MFNFLNKLKSFKSPTVQRLVTVEFSSIICENSVSTGNILINNNIRIDGRHIGKIVKDASCKEIITVIIAKTGVVEGSINVDNVIIEGSMKGVTKANIALFVLGSIEGTAFYGNNLEISGSSSAQILKLNERQLQIKPDNNIVINEDEKIKSLATVMAKKSQNHNLSKSIEPNDAKDPDIEQAMALKPVSLSGSMTLNVNDMVISESVALSGSLDCVAKGMNTTESVSLGELNELDVDEVITVDADGLSDSSALEVEELETLESVALNESKAFELDELAMHEREEMQQPITLLSEKLYLVKSNNLSDSVKNNEITKSQVKSVNVIQNYNYSPKMAFI